MLLALPRPKVMRRLWPQLAALGVGHIILTNAERVERHYFDTHVLTEACYRPLLVEGLQQARDTRLPKVSIHRQFRILVEDHLDGLSVDGLRLVADPRGSTPVGSADVEHRGRRVLIAIGPEGGWNAFELSLLAAHGFQLVGMGPRTLRVDTACDRTPGYHACGALKKSARNGLLGSWRAAVSHAGRDIDRLALPNDRVRDPSANGTPESAAEGPDHRALTTRGHRPSAIRRIERLAHRKPSERARRGAYQHAVPNGVAALPVDSPDVNCVELPAGRIEGHGERSVAQ